MKATKAMTTRFRNSDGIKFIDNPALRSPAELRRLVKHAVSATSETGNETEVVNDLDLFKAMHACALLAQADGRSRQRVSMSRSRLMELHEAVTGKLVNGNVGLVYDMLRRSGLGGRDDAEMISAGFWALFQAVTSFDPWRGYQFSTYACQSILRGFNHVGRREARRRRTVQNFEDTSNLTHASESGEDPTLGLMTDRLRMVLHSNAASLTPTERFIIQRRFLEPRSTRRETLESIGKVIQLSKERVRQIQADALGKLRLALQDDPVLRASQLVPDAVEQG